MGEIEDLRLFLAVAEEGSFIGAARVTGMTPSSVTRSIAALEERLGVQLFVRTTRRVSLTSAGAAYAARVRPLTQDLASANEELRERHGETAGTIRLNAPLAIGSDILPGIIAQFRVLYPLVKFSVTLSDRFVESIEEGYDLAIRISREQKGVLNIWRKICRIERVLVAAPHYLKENGTPHQPEDLENHTCIGHDSEAMVEIWTLSSEGLSYRLRAGGSLVANNAALMAGLARHAQGVVLLPRFIVREDLEAGRLVPVLQDWDVPHLWLTLYYPPYERLPARLIRFSEFLETNVVSLISGHN